MKKKIFTMMFTLALMVLGTTMAAFAAPNNAGVDRHLDKKLPK